MNAGAPRITLHIYRLGPNGKLITRSTSTVTGTPDPERLPDSLAWPPCHCPRCRTGHGPAPGLRN
ncbi:hypothetical protein [Streptomyces apocyni]|uniref:hypothetical protein n=1 Tax=Streptomyces apocyni TaxID=2654677 RepID=UPI0012E9E26E|nr:hypothetical protein [Streptomyces apocyni]